MKEKQATKDKTSMRSRIVHKMQQIVRAVADPKKTARRAKEMAIETIETTQYIGSFAWLLSVYVSARCIKFAAKFPLIPNSLKQRCAPPLSRLYKKLIAPAQMSEKAINRLNLIELAIKHMEYKKSRSLITIGGMSVGIAAIVFLVSVGFGLQDLVINRVARLNELKQADVSVQTGSNLSIDDKTISSISDIPGVNNVMPLIAVVGRVSLNESIFDVAVFGVTSDYLNSSAIKPVKGRIFDSNDLTVQLPVEERGVVAGASSQKEIAEYGKKIQDVDFVIDQDEWLPVREGPTNKSTLLGYTRREIGTQLGEEYWGSSYLSEDGAGDAGITIDQEPLGRWIKSVYLLWDKEICLVSENPNCVDNNYIIQRENESTESAQIEEIGYIVEKGLSVRETYNLDVFDIEGNIQEGSSNVLGESDDASTSGNLALSTEQIQQRTDGYLDGLDLDASSAALLEIEGLIASASAGTENVRRVDLDERAVKEAIVNRAMLNLLGLSEDEAVGKTFTASFVVVGALTEDEEKIQSEDSEYTIVGVDPENETPFFYVPFVDVRTLGVTNYSQLKVVAQSEEDLKQIRDQIAVLGYATSSVVDTVERITSFFGTLRIILALVGGVALAVASLGMFNTLTVSLLERTREVGLMKAMGMRSYEVQELFLTESMIMGFFGGLFGIFLGVGAGKLLSLLLTVFSVTQGSGLINISSTPLIFIVVTMVFSLMVGLLTGVFPARRATQISALDALRYE